MPDILQSKPSAEQSTFITGIQSRSCSYSSFYQYNDECMLSTLYDSHSIFFILWLQIFIIVFQQRFFKCQVNYCEIKALLYVILCDFFLPEVGNHFIPPRIFLNSRRPYWFFHHCPFVRVSQCLNLWE